MITAYLKDEELLAHSVQKFKEIAATGYGWNRNSTVSYLVVNDNGGISLNWKIGAGCHVDLCVSTKQTKAKPHYAYVLHAVSDRLNSYTEGLAHRYYDYLFNRSPLRDAYLTKDASTVLECGIAVSARNGPQEIAGMACKAIRHTWEKPSMVQGMFSLVDSGLFTEDEAFFLGFCFHVRDGSLVHSISTGHVTLYINNLDTHALNNWLSYTKPKEYKTMAEIKGYTGCVTYWNHNQAVAPQEKKMLTFLSSHKNFVFFQGTGSIAEVNPNPFGLLPELFRKEKAKNSYELLREMIDDLKAEGQKKEKAA